ncbi:MAG: HAMP domain-containing histidine kinase [Alphaproteobacteria bacterium]|jgi:signal transduction histidine kinase|nr:HAMP domain-containing histidine kinase [Alphaproteobacteria bacterium]MBU1551981.1 HAMP domain-containing histidine kinase [Alphaproteobacteria bacterium]MBU2337528.1 HAMP domain-containing histidine kinase [Alphaproteobacteria bacterium]MBU2388169.1 HAMP domain-containing histidine kinase [Alphaproteobacteria bacterium]
MRAASFLKSTATRLAIIYTCLFVLSYLSANVVAYQMVLGYLNERLNDNVMERFREIETAYEARGIAGAVEMVESHGPAIRGEETIYSLRDPAGEKLAGNFEIGTVPQGFSTLTPSDEAESRSHYMVYRGQLGGHQLVVGASSGDTDQLARIVLISFGWTTAVVFAIGLGGAAISTFRSRSRIAALSRTAHEIGHGELSKRLPVSPRMDEIDILSTEVNVALSRLELSVEALKQVSTDIAHDLKTPIGRTFLTLDDALGANTLDEAKGGIEAGLAELRSVADTFDAVLRIAQIESRSRTAKFQPVDLKVLVRDIYETYDVIASDEGYRLGLQEPAAGCWINGDPDLIRQLLANLLANSMRHTPLGSSILIDLARQEDAVVLSVSDNGPGIPPEERGRVLDRFYRLEKSRTTVGSGLGLSMVKAIAELHGAQVELADNSPGLRVSVAVSASSAKSLEKKPELSLVSEAPS